MEYTYRHPYRSDVTHIDIDAFYLGSNGNLILTIPDTVPLRRPAYDMRVTIVNARDSPDHIAVKVPYSDTWYEPDSNVIGFCKHWFPWPVRYGDRRPVSRFIGDKPIDRTKCRYNWYFNPEQRRISMILSA